MLKKSTAAFMIVAALLCGSLLTLGVTGYVQVFGQAAGEGLAASVRPTYGPGGQGVTEAWNRSEFD